MGRAHLWLPLTTKDSRPWALVCDSLGSLPQPRPSPKRWKSGKEPLSEPDTAYMSPTFSGRSLSSGFLSIEEVSPQLSPVSMMNAVRPPGTPAAQVRPATPPAQDPPPSLLAPCLPGTRSTAGPDSHFPPCIPEGPAGFLWSEGSQPPVRKVTREEPEASEFLSPSHSHLL